MVDVDEVRLREMQNRLDLRTVSGNASHPSVLREAGIEDADMMIAVTQSDELNLVAGKLAASFFNVPTRIARIRATEFLDNERVLGEDGFSVNLAICPEQILTDYIVKLIQFPEALQVLEFAQGKVSLIAVRAFQGGPLVGHPLKDLRRHIPSVDARVAAIFRGDRSIVPEGDTIVEPGDEVFCLAATQDIRHVMRELRRMDKPVKRVMIGGGGNIGRRLAKAIEDKCEVTIIEYNKASAERLAAEISSYERIKGPSTGGAPAPSAGGSSSSSSGSGDFNSLGDLLDKAGN